MTEGVLMVLALMLALLAVFFFNIARKSKNLTVTFYGGMSALLFATGSMLALAMVIWAR